MTGSDKRDGWAKSEARHCEIGRRGWEISDDEI